MRSEGEGVPKCLQGPFPGTGVGSHSEDFFPADEIFTAPEGQMALFQEHLPEVRRVSGRPGWSKANEYRGLVDYLLEVGALQAEIALAVGVSVPTLVHYFFGTPTWQARWGHRSRSPRRETQDA